MCDCLVACFAIFSKLQDRQQCWMLHAYAMVVSLRNVDNVASDTAFLLNEWTGSFCYRHRSSCGASHFCTTVQNTRPMQECQSSAALNYRRNRLWHNNFSSKLGNTWHYTATFNDHVQRLYAGKAGTDQRRWKLMYLSASMAATRKATK